MDEGRENETRDMPTRARRALSGGRPSSTTALNDSSRPGRKNRESLRRCDGGSCNVQWLPVAVAIDLLGIHLPHPEATPCANLVRGRLIVLVSACPSHLGHQLVFIAGNRAKHQGQQRLLRSFACSGRLVSERLMSLLAAECYARLRPSLAPSNHNGESPSAPTVFNQRCQATC